VEVKVLAVAVPINLDYYTRKLKYYTTSLSKNLREIKEDTIR
jgi:hypothetical protein